MSELSIKRIDYEHPDSQKLVAEVQAEYVEMYGSGDEAPLSAEDFTPGQGEFFVGYIDDRPIAMGGWRKFDGATAEIKRMFVVVDYRRMGFAAQMLHHVEEAIKTAGFKRAILGTGAVQIAAIEMYLRNGYERIEPFGYYQDPEDSRHYGKSFNE